MGNVMEFLRRLRYFLSRHRRSRELDDEMAFHREMAERAGRPEARRRFGSPVRLQEQAREAWGWTWIDRLVQDLSYAARTLRKSPGFTLAAMLVLAVGIGVNVTAFSLFNMMVLQYLPIKDPASIVRLQRRSPDASTNTISYAAMTFYRDHVRTLSAVMGTLGTGSLQIENDAKLVGGSFATGNYFTEIGTRPMLGRLLSPYLDDAANAPPVVILSYAEWRDRFSADPNVVGRVIRINQKPATVIGVTPEDLVTPGRAYPKLWLPLSQVAYFIDGNTTLSDVGSSGGVEMWGRLAPGVSAQAAEKELLALTRELHKIQPKDMWENEYIRSDPGGHDQMMQPDMAIAMGAAGGLALLILAVACANLGGLLLARGVMREHEIGIRVAVGASWKRIFRQLATESLLLSSIGSLTGLVLGYVVLRIVMAYGNAPLWMSARPDWRVVVFTFGVGVFAAALFGFAPALQISRQKQRKTVVRQMLLGAQVAGSCVLLIVAGLLVRAATHALYSYPGFGYEQVLSVDLGLGSHGYKPASARGFLDQFESRVRSVPGVTLVAVTSMPPLGHNRISTISNTINGHLVRIFPFTVDPDFFALMEIPFVRGRNFFPGEQHAVIISDSLARKQWPGENPIGKTDASGSAPGDVVVGIVGNAQMLDMHDGDTTELYHAAREADMADLVVLIKTAGKPEGFAPSVREIAQGIDPKVFPDIHTMKEGFKYETQSAKMMAGVVSLMGMIAVCLASLGILGLVAYTVSQRTKEIAIRLALGARRGHVIASILRQFWWPVGLGLVAGTSLTIGLSQVIRRVLYGVSNLDPVSYAAALAVLAAIILAAAVLPARRALKLDIARALHQE